MKKLNLHLYRESETLLSPISARIEMVVYEHKVFMTLVNILLSALRHWLSTTQGRHNRNFLGKPTGSFLLLQYFNSQPCGVWHFSLNHHSNYVYHYVW